MKNSTAHAKQLKTLLGKIGDAAPADLPDADDGIAVLVQSFLLWEATTAQAADAYRRIGEGVVDFNELRVCMPHEIVDLVGSRYPAALDRANRLRACLRDIYRREHAVTLERIAEESKRDIRKYVESLEGIVPYVAARLLLLHFDTHAIPADDRLRAALAKEGVIEDDVDVTELASWLTRQVRAGEGAVAHAKLQSWCDARRAAASRSRKKSKKSSKKGGKKTTKKSSRKSAARASA